MSVMTRNFSPGLTARLVLTRLSAVFSSSFSSAFDALGKGNVFVLSGVFKLRLFAQLGIQFGFSRVESLKSGDSA
jgi:hypothetical protein